MRGGAAPGPRFTAHSDDVARFHTRPWYVRVIGLERWLRKQYGDVIYRGGSYERRTA